jgi:hypothetical protein
MLYLSDLWPRLVLPELLPRRHRGPQQRLLQLLLLSRSPFHLPVTWRILLDDLHFRRGTILGHGRGGRLGPVLGRGDLPSVRLGRTESELSCHQGAEAGVLARRLIGRDKDGEDNISQTLSD